MKFTVTAKQPTAWSINYE